MGCLKKELLWQDPIPARDYELIENRRKTWTRLKGRNPRKPVCGRPVGQAPLVAQRPKHLSAVQRQTGAVQWARTHPAVPDEGWEATTRPVSDDTLRILRRCCAHDSTTATNGRKRVSLADVIVAGAVSCRLKKAGKGCRARC